MAACQVQGFARRFNSFSALIKRKQHGFKHWATSVSTPLFQC
jgi:hypothetical protein